MFGLTTTKKLKAAEDAALQMHNENSDLRRKLRAAERECAGLRDDVRSAEAGFDKERAEGIKKGRMASELLTERDAALDRAAFLEAKLREINGMVTPGCAGIGRKMARAAREVLPEYAAGEWEAA